MKKLLVFLIPLGLFLVLAIFLFQGLFSDPRQRNSSVVGKAAPAFALPDLMRPEVTYTEDVFKGDVTLLNVWGVWCVTCAVELPYLTDLSNFPLINEVMAEFVEEPYPARAAVGVASLPKDAQVEMDAILVI